MTRLKGTAPILETKDLKNTVGYYQSVLGFRLGGLYPAEGDPWWAEMRRDDAVIMLCTRNAHSKVPEPTFTGSIYIYPSNVDEIWEELKDKVEISYPIETFDYGMREFGIVDCNGYLLQFGQEAEH